MVATTDALLPDPGNNRLLKAALAYADLGWDVFPCVPRDKVPLTPNGLKDASHDPAQIRLWWQRHPAANIGGVTTGRLVIDVDADPDPAKDGMVWHNSAGRDLLAETVTQITGGGGLQYIYSRTGGKVGNSAGKIAPGVDVRADGGYIILPPSVHPSGAVYRWVDGASPRQRDPAPAPDVLLALVTAPRELPVVAPTTPASEIPPGLLRYALAGKAEGGRNDGAFWLACKLVEEVGTGYEARKVLGTYGYNCTPPLTEAELEKVWTSAQRTTSYSPRLAPMPTPPPVALPGGAAAEAAPIEPACILALLERPDDLWAVAPFLQPGHFQHAGYGAIYGTICDLAAARTPIDRVTVESALRAGPRWAALAPIWASLPASAPGAATETYARLIFDTARRVRLGTVGTRLQALSSDATRPVDTVLEEAETLLFTLLQNGTPRRGDLLRDVLNTYLDDLAARQANPTKLPGVPTGFADLDLLTGGFGKKKLIVEGAPTASGKSTLGLVHLLAAQAAGIPAALVSIEMANDEVVQRALANAAGVDSMLLQAGALDDPTYQRVTDAAGTLADRAPVLLYDQRVGLPELRHLARHWKAQYGIGLLLVDYLQIMETEETRNRTADVSELVYGLKGLASELDLPIIAAAQLNRAALSCADPYQWLNYLRESGAIEQAANLIIFPYFPPVTLSDGTIPDEQPVIMEGKLVIAKQRGGPTGAFPVRWDKATSRIQALSQRVEGR